MKKDVDDKYIFLVVVCIKVHLSLSVLFLSILFCTRFHYMSVSEVDFIN